MASVDTPDDALTARNNDAQRVWLCRAELCFGWKDKGSEKADNGSYTSTKEGLMKLFAAGVS